MNIKDDGVAEYLNDDGSNNIQPRSTINIYTSENKEEINNIPNNLYAREMRLCMENKLLLRKNGSLYVGTGSVERFEIQIDPTSSAAKQIIDVPIVAPLVPPSDANPSNKYVLTWDGSKVSWEKM